MKWMFALTAMVLAAFPSVAPALPDDAAKWLLGAQPLTVRKLDVDLDGDQDRVAAVRYRDGQVEVVALCYNPTRRWQPWERCGSLGVGGRGQSGTPKVERLTTGDFDGDGGVDLLAEVETTDGLHHLALGPLLKPLANTVAPELHLTARAFTVWDIAADNQAEVVAWQPAGATNGPSYITFVRETAGWRRSHGVDLPATGGGTGGLPLARIPDVRGEPLPAAVAMLNGAGLRPGMIAAVDEGKGFRNVKSQRPAPGEWARGGQSVDLAVTVPAYPPTHLTDLGDIARVVVHGPGGKRVEVKPEELKGWREELRRALATASRRVRVGGPPLKGPIGVPLVHGETAVEVFFSRPLRMELPEGTVEASSVLLPFFEYESGLLFLGTPDYREAVTYTAAEGLQNRAYLLTHDPPTHEGSLGSFPVSSAVSTPALNLVDPDYPPGIADGGWQYRESVEADLDGDGAKETVWVTARASWNGRSFDFDDGQPWQVYVEEADGKRTYLYSRWVQIGALEVGISEDHGKSSVVILERGGLSFALYRIHYGGPGVQRAESIGMAQLRYRTSPHSPPAKRSGEAKGYRLHGRTSRAIRLPLEIL